MLSTRTACADDWKIAAEIEIKSFTREEAAGKACMKERMERYADRYMFLIKYNEPVAYIGGPLTMETRIRDEMYENISFHDPSGRYQSIFSLAVLPDHQDNGYASVLMKEYIEKCRQEGLEGIYLTCRERLVPYYEQFGYKNMGVSESVHGGIDWFDMLLKF